MAHTIPADLRLLKVKEEPEFGVTNRKGRRRIRSKKKGATQQSLKHGRIHRWYD